MKYFITEEESFKRNCGCGGARSSAVTVRSSQRRPGARRRGSKGAQSVTSALHSTDEIRKLKQSKYDESQQKMKGRSPAPAMSAEPQQAHAARAAAPRHSAAALAAAGVACAGERGRDAAAHHAGEGLHLAVTARRDRLESDLCFTRCRGDSERQTVGRQLKV